jgi:hypothetical protein
MIKWEYLFIKCSYSLSLDFIPQYANRQKLRFDSPVSIYDYCNQLGEEGWELACISEVGDIMRFIFKRPKG